MIARLRGKRGKRTDSQRRSGMRSGAGISRSSATRPASVEGDMRTSGEALEREAFEPVMSKMARVIAWSVKS